MVSVKLNPEIPVIRVGNLISVSVMESHEAVVTELKFDNHELAIPKSLEQRHDAVQAQQVVTQDSRNADATWEKLSPENKRKLVQQRQGPRGGLRAAPLLFADYSSILPVAGSISISSSSPSLV